MKKIRITLFSLLAIVTIASCSKDYEELNTDPNNSATIPADLLLGTTQRVYMNVMHGVLGGAGGDMGAMWAQLWTKVQYNDEERYVPRRSVMDGVWSSTYASVISEAKAMEELAIIEENTNLQAAAIIMQATGYQFLTDLYGPIPFTQAINPDILKPAYDDESVVYEGIIAMYSQAASLLANGSGTIVASSDLFYGGDTTQWLKLANSLKFRALMRISSTRDVGSELQALINGGELMTSNADNAQVSYLSAQPDANPIYETIDFGTREEYKINALLVDFMEASNDPRLAVYAAVNASGNILGKPGGYGNQTPLPNEALGYTYANISGLGEFYLNPELPGVLLSYYELKFLMAEAANEGLISGGLVGAEAHYLDGINASFEFNEVSSASYLAQLGIGFTSQNDAKQKIGDQKWVSLFAQGFEAWTEVRRTNIPNLIPVVEANIDQVPSRYFYPTTEVSLNSDSYNAGASSIGGDQLTSPLFWQ